MQDSITNRLGYTNYIGVDVTNWYHAGSTDALKGRIRVVGNVEEFLNISSASYALVLILQCLEHIPKRDQQTLLATVRKRLMPGGLLIVEVPNATNWYVGSYLRYGDITHEVGFTDCSLCWTLYSAGFSKEAVVVKPLRVPLTSPFRVVQSLLQSLLTALQRTLMRAFFPSGRILTSMYIYAVGRNGD